MHKTHIIISHSQYRRCSPTKILRFERMPALRFSSRRVFIYKRIILYLFRSTANTRPCLEISYWKAINVQSEYDVSSVRYKYTHTNITNKNIRVLRRGFFFFILLVLRGLLFFIISVLIKRTNFACMLKKKNVQWPTSRYRANALNIPLNV